MALNIQHFPEEDIEDDEDPLYEQKLAERAMREKGEKRRGRGGGSDASIASANANTEAGTEAYAGLNIHGKPRHLYQDAWTEVTSSGLTHSCAGDGIGVNSLLCPLMLNTFNRHRHVEPLHDPLGHSWWVGDIVGAHTTASSSNSSNNSDSSNSSDSGSKSHFDPLYNVNSDGWYIGSNIGSINFDKHSLNVSGK